MPLRANFWQRQHGGCLGFPLVRRRGSLIIPSIPTPNGSGTSALKTILVLDDDPDSGNVLCWVIERSYRVLRASTADEAVDFWHEHNGSIGLIVADIFLSSPVSGTQVAIQVRES